jgi:hypothetical protein
MTGHLDQRQSTLPRKRTGTLMSKATSHGLARVQSESRFPAAWRDGCNRLELDPHLAVEGWDEVCHPIRRLVRSICDGKVSLEDLLILARKKLPTRVAEDEYDVEVVVEEEEIKNSVVRNQEGTAHPF